jgi:N-acetylglucosamine-6-phosphate deacetylase
LEALGAHAVEFCRSAKAAGCLVTCGHSNASWPEMAAVYEVGMRHVDHFWNAMSSVDSIRKRLATPQRGSMAEFVLYHPEMRADALVPGEQLQPGARHAAGSRTARRSGGSRCDRCHNGAVGVLPGGTALASSIFPLEHMVRVMTRDTDAGLAKVIRMASLTPAERTGFAEDRGSLERGKFADVVILSRELHVKRTFIDGIEFCRMPSSQD